MWSYLKTLRRKAGVITLALACVFAAGWIRSLAATDLICVPVSTKRINILIGYDGTLSWSGRESNRWEPLYSWMPTAIDPHRSIKPRWQAKWLGFDFVAGNVRDEFGIPISYWRIPYWSIVTPLTLLSAWLLLSKPRIVPGTREAST